MRNQLTFISTITLFALTLSLSACGGKDDDNDEKDGDKTNINSSGAENSSGSGAGNSNGSEENRPDDADTGVTKPVTPEAEPEPEPASAVTAETIAQDFEQVVSSLASCDLLESASSYFGEAPATDFWDCVLKCTQERSCDESEAYYCNALNADPCVDACELAEFKCDDGTKVKDSYQCDGFSDCADDSDEDGCSYFVCDTGDEITSLAYTCDGQSDCSDGSDEAGCAAIICN